MKLIKPEPKYLESYLKAIEETEPNNKFAPEIFFMPEDKDLFKTMDNYENGIDLPEGYVPSTFLWLIDNNEFIGTINIRHRLTPYLLYYGGHIGYAVRYSKWNQGYCTKMLALALEYCRNNLGLNQVMITCNNDNIGSKRVLEKNGGVLQEVTDIVVDGKNIKSRRYWFFLDNTEIRIAGVLIKDNCILMQREIRNKEYALPGGHLETGETMSECLLREFSEETGYKISVNRLLWIENSEWVFKGKNHISKTYYFLIDSDDDIKTVAQSDNPDIVFEWIPVPKLKEITFYPSFLADELNTITDQPKEFTVYYR